MIDVDGYVDDRRELRRWLTELFVLVNFGFLAIEVYIAHSTNEFAVEIEWLPVYFSAAAPMLLLPSVVGGSREKGAGWLLGLVVGVASVAVGIGGMFLHLGSSFFARQTLHSLVYAAPFVAPLAYAGVGLLLILNRMEHEEWGRWVVFLAFGGFVGNFGLALLDHAENGFFNPAEWIPVVSAGLAVGFLGTALAVRDDRSLLKATMWVMGLQVLVGGLGFILHAIAVFSASGPGLWTKIVYGAPMFAPLLFPDIAALAAIGVWELLDVSDDGE